MRFTAFTFIQVFYLLGFHLYKFATFSFLSPWNLAKVSDNRFTVSTSAETEGNRGWGWGWSDAATRVEAERDQWEERGVHTGSGRLQ